MGVGTGQWWLVPSPITLNLGRPGWARGPWESSWEKSLL